MSQPRFDFDLFVIGGGSGGIRAARIASAELGLRVGLAEADRLGGTCVIRGCVPKKLMVFASEAPSAVETARSFGWDICSNGFDWPQFRTKLHGELHRLEGIYQGLLGRSNVTVYSARASFADAHTLRLSTGEEIRAKHILVATGGRPIVPPIPGAELGIVSADVFNLETLPRRLLIIGAGYVACEFATIFRGLGCEVAQYYRGDRILRGFDEEAATFVADHMRQGGIRMRGNVQLTGLARHADGIAITAADAPAESFDQVLFATGRRPNTEGLALENAGLAVGADGEVVVDRFSRTRRPSIHAIGDVTNRLNLTPVAISEAMAFVATAFSDAPTPVDHDLVPSAVFTSPEFATVGLSEEAARERGPVDVYRTSFRPMQGTFLPSSGKVFMKLVVSRGAGKVLGCHIVAPRAGEMIQLAAIALRMGATKSDFDRTLGVHPTMAEELVTMRKTAS